MALFHKAGSILRQSVCQNSASMLNSVRWMSSTKLFIRGLSFGTDDNSLRQAFSGFGEVVSARVLKDSTTGKSRGCGFVQFTDSESADFALSSMDGMEVHGRSIRVSIATERPPGPRGGNFGSDGGGYGGGGSYQRNSGYGGADDQF